MAFNLAALAPLAGIGQGLDAIRARELKEQQLIREREQQEYLRQQRRALPLAYQSLLGGQPGGQAPQAQPGGVPGLAALPGQSARGREFVGTGSDTAGGTFVGTGTDTPGVPSMERNPTTGQWEIRPPALAQLPGGGADMRFRGPIGPDAGITAPGFGQAPDTAGMGTTPYPSDQERRFASGPPAGLPSPSRQQTEVGLSSPAQPRDPTAPLPMVDRAGGTPGYGRVIGGQVQTAAADPQHTRNLEQFGITEPQGGTDPNHKRIAVNVMDKGQKLVQSGSAPREVVEASTQNAYAVGKQIDPRKWGYVGLPEMVQMIERTAPPGTPDIIKAIALGQLNELLAPGDKQAVQSMFKEREQEIKRELAEAKRNEDMWRTLYTTGARQQQGEETRAAANWSDPINIGTPEKPRYVRVQRSTGKVEPLDLGQEPGAPPATKIGTAGRGGAGAGADRFSQPKAYEYTDAEGKAQHIELRTSPTKAGYFDADTNELWQKPAGIKNFKQVTASTSGGGRAGAQTQRQITAAPEIAIDLESVRDLPFETTSGIFGEVTSGPTLLQAVKGDLGRRLTSNSERMMQMALSGVGRELAIIQSPVYLNTRIADQMDKLIPKDGDTVAVALYGLARMRMIATNAIDSILPSPILTEEQKAYAKEVKGRIERAIPWTLRDAQLFGQKGKQRESFIEFTERKGMGGGTTGQPTAPSGGAPPGAADSQPLPSEFQGQPDGFAQRNKQTGEIWVKKGNRIIKTPGGEPTPPPQ